ncbi:hypothetical protein GCM10009853_058730 [Glycomyces scopariae]|uniref:Uncharacterized protein n=1 Tax=Glycomyces sambucus TaxID=380244 RepID=A0A1G9GRF3_9ACTN|nr:hypothetical protein [Glycomyces sambucus]SDL03214.1 hypothetical protein SAMN05216298_2373 [Glycomyces sambucus]
MRKCGLRRLVLVASVIGAVGVLSLPWYAGADPRSDSAVSEVDWVNADETNPWPPGSDLTESPSYDGDGTADGPDGEDGQDGGDGSDGEGGPGGDGPTGEAGNPGSGPADGGENESDGILGLAFPVQAGMSVGLLALAFLALLPGRRMPANLR